MRPIVVLLALIALSGVSVFAQSGRLLGTVQSPDGVIAGAQLVITDNLTKKEITVTTNGQGSFSIANLNIGLYTVKVTAPGYKTFIATNVKIDVGQEYTFNPKLEVGEVTAEVTITAGADLVNASNAELSNTISQNQLQDLPINGRDPQALIQLQAGVTQGGSINGQRTSATNYTRDGFNVQDNFIRTGGYVPDLPKIDNVGEFSVVTGSSQVDSGAGGSSQVRYPTPRGGTDYHGALYYYNQNSAFASNTFFNNRDGQEKPVLNQHQFGGTIGGRLPFPRFGEGGPAYFRDKAFFFFNYEGLRLPATSSVIRTILTPTARQGIFTYIDDNGVRRQDNILQRTGLGTPPLGLSSVVAQRILAGMPTVGNNTDVGDGLNTTGYKINQRADFNRDQTVSRFDFDFSAKHTLNVVWTFNKENILRPDTDSGGFNVQPYGNQTDRRNLIGGAYIWTPSGRFNNELRVGGSKDNPFFNTSGLPTNFFIGNPLTDNTENGFLPQGRTTKYFSVQDNAEFRLGQHSLRGGYQGHYYRIESFGGATLPTYNLDNTYTIYGFVGEPGELSGPLTDENQLAVANALQSLLGGLVGSATNTFNVTSKTSGYVAGAPTINTFNYNNHAFYISDQWRAKSNLTINVGLRYELFTGVTDPRGLRLEPVIRSQDPVTDILNPAGTYNYVGGNAGQDGQFFKTDKDNFGPSISVAYSLRTRNSLARRILGEDQTVIRGGYKSSFINDEYVRAADNALQNAGLTQPVTVRQLSANISAPPAIPVPTFQTPPITYARNNALAGNFGTVFGIDPNLQLPRLHEYNFGIQRNFGGQTALEIRYVGNQSSQLIRTIDYNQIDIRDNGFVNDFIKARQNLILSNNTSGAYNPKIAGSQQLSVFPLLVGGGFLSDNAVRPVLLDGRAADLALLYVQNGLGGTVKFLPNPNTGVANLLRSVGKVNYNSLQVELRRRYAKGLTLQTNYTFQKTLTDVGAINLDFGGGDSQSRVSPFLDNRNQRLDYARANYDQTHIFNFGGSYDLPFGSGRAFLGNANGVTERVFGGWNVGVIVRFNTGYPLTFQDRRGTLNRAGRSTLQAPQVSLTQDQLTDLVGIRTTADTVYFIDPKIINSVNGRGAAAYGQTAFAGQVFFNNGPGQTGNLQRSFINGPSYTNVNLSVKKRVKITERVNFYLRGEAFNLFNHTNFFAGDSSGAIFNINSNNFGKITQQYSTGGLNRVLQLSGRIEF